MTQHKQSACLLFILQTRVPLCVQNKGGRLLKDLVAQEAGGSSLTDVVVGEKARVSPLNSFTPPLRTSDNGVSDDFSQRASTGKEIICSGMRIPQIIHFNFRKGVDSGVFC